MDDLISRQEAIDAINASRSVYSGMWGEGLAMAINTLRDLPSAQPEIIRCEECKHWRDGDVYSYCQKLFNCGVLDVYDYMRAENDFCSLAERREE